MTCPLCGHLNQRSSWLGQTTYRGQYYSYAQCLQCHSLYCDPMPTAETLVRMYGPDYAHFLSAEENLGGGDGVKRVINRLKRTRRGTFIDYGCGAGHLLRDAARLGWHAIGVEFDQGVVAKLANRSDARIVTDPAELADNTPADVLHLGDVIEHLTEVELQIPQILGLIKPGGLLLAQGPLEANANLFTLMLRWSKTLRPKRQLEMPPYHVILATSKGQRRFFQRFGLKELEFLLSEVAWPAFNTLSLRDLRHPREVGLFCLRRVSQAVSALRPGCWGNRYFYAGRWNG